jgi:hypothetical protein
MQVLQMSQELLGGLEIGVPPGGEVIVRFPLGDLLPLPPKPRGLSRIRDMGNEDELTAPKHHLDLSTRLIQAELA